MTGRTLVFAGSLLAAFGVAGSRAEPPVAPPPREVGSAAGPTGPAATIDRIIKNSNDVGDRLSKTDPGTATQRTQAQILKDIESLLKQPPSGGGSDDMKEPSGGRQAKKNEPDPGGGKDKSPPMKGGQDQKSDPMAKGGMEPMPAGDPMAGQQPKHQPRRPRADTQTAAKPPPMPGTGDTKEPTEPGMNQTAKAGGTEPKKEPGPMPMPGGKDPGTPKDEKDPAAPPASPTGGAANGPTGAGSYLPLDEDTAKKVWGGPRDQLRKQVDQYYTERFMPGYSTLLKGYYAHLAAGAVKK